MEEQSRDYEDRILEMQRLIDGFQVEILTLQSANGKNMLNLQEVMETMKSDQQHILRSKGDEVLQLSEKLTDCTAKLTRSEENFVNFKENVEAQWEPLFLCFQTLLEETKMLKKCLKTNNIDEVIPFLEETRRCYKGGDVSDKEKREALHDQLSAIYSAFRDIAMAWMKNAVGADKDYDYKDLAEVYYN